MLAQIDNIEASIINTHRINVIQQTPSVWKQILEMISPEQLRGITCLMGGEVVDQATLQKNAGKRIRSNKWLWSQ